MTELSFLVTGYSGAGYQRAGGEPSAVRLAIRIDRTDPVIPFNLGNALEAAGRRGEAILAFGQSIARDAALAEAWLNLEAVREEMNRLAEAVGCYRQA